MTSSAREFRQGLLDVLPILVAAAPIGLLWGTLATGKGLVPFEVWLMSATVFAGAAQFVAIEVWRDPGHGSCFGPALIVISAMSSWAHPCHATWVALTGAGIRS